MIAIIPANSFPERFLNDFVDPVGWQHRSDTQGLCCPLRFHADSQLLPSGLNPPL
ncbi:hypothetical protein [Oscillatoria acuminata]|uniref:hypothetical protein n=1 Tax=Oscillatoria acuminata TaxID=118323 RepID=UPI0002FD527D|nr:hypothetical protein [Oscillatoria acuminata]